MSKSKDKTDFLDEQEFYELMQSYRHAPLGNQAEVIKRFQEVKEFIRKMVNRAGKL